MIAMNYSAFRSVKSFDTRVRFLVFHYTAVNFKDSVAALTGKLVSAHYLVPDPTDPTYLDSGFTDVEIFNLVDEKDRSWHAGTSVWQGRNNLNDSSIGVEVVNLATDKDGHVNFPDYNPRQIEAIIALGVSIVQRYPMITPKRVVGHADIAFRRKCDPGPKFPWHALYLQGVGAWPDDCARKAWMTKFEAEGLPAVPAIIEAFARYGYDAGPSMGDGNYQNMVRVFQMHFRPANYNGVVDTETCAILYALNEKYSA